MDTKNIPATFWYALSFCMVVATLGLLFIAYRSTTVSIEIANAKIELSSAISQTKEIKSDLKVENDRLIASSKALEERLALLEAEASLASGGGGDETTGMGSSISIEDLKNSGLLSFPTTTQFNTEKFQALDARIQSAEQALK